MHTSNQDLSDLIEPLTLRELEILRELAQGKSNRQIAKTLFVSMSTVKYHLKSIFGKLQVKNRTEAARMYWEGKVPRARRRKLPDGQMGTPLKTLTRTAEKPTRDARTSTSTVGIVHTPSMYFVCSSL